MKAFFGLLRKLTTALLISLVVVVVVVLVVKRGQFSYFKILNEKLSYSLYDYISSYMEKHIPNKILTAGRNEKEDNLKPKICTEKSALKSTKECTFLVGDIEKHGSGFVIETKLPTSESYLVTNYHVIDHFSDGFANVYYNGQFHSSRIAGFSVEDDLAIIKLDADLPNCEWSDSQSLELAENVFAVGWPNSPYGESTITKGIFSRYTTLENQNIQMVQTDTPINPGNSGGPLINKCGVIGINTSKTNWIDDSAPSEGIGYAISSNYAQDVISKLIQKDDGSPMIPTKIIETEITQETSEIPQSETNNYLNPNSTVAYNYEQVLFWERQKIEDEAILNSWKKAEGSEFIDEDRLDNLIDSMSQGLEVAEILWDGYTNSKITYAQVLELKQEYFILSKEAMYLTKDLNVEGSINAFKNCVESWENLEKEYDEDFSEQIEKCEELLEVN